MSETMYVWTVKTSDPILVELHESREGWDSSDYTLEYISDIPAIIEEITSEARVDGFSVTTGVEYITDRTKQHKSDFYYDNSTYIRRW